MQQKIRYRASSDRPNESVLYRNRQYMKLLTIANHLRVAVVEGVGDVFLVVNFRLWCAYRPLGAHSELADEAHSCCCATGGAGGGWVSAERVLGGVDAPAWRGVVGGGGGGTCRLLAIFLQRLFTAIQTISMTVASVNQGKSNKQYYFA